MLVSEPVPDCSVYLCRRYFSLLDETMTDDDLSDAEEIQQPVVDAETPDSKLVNAISQVIAIGSSQIVSAFRKQLHTLVAVTVFAERRPQAWKSRCTRSVTANARRDFCRRLVP